jgi:hypothetical protein
METERLKLEEQKLALEADIEEAKFKAGHELEGIKLGREMGVEDTDE